MKYLIKCDIFSIHFHFFREGKIKFQTKYGLWFTLIYMFIVIGLFFGFGIELYTRKNPKVSFNSLVKQYEEKTLTNNNFLFAYRIEDIDGIEVRDESIIGIELNSYIYIKTNGEWNITKSDDNINKTRCLDIPNIDKHEKYYNISLKNWYCINFENKSLGGFWDGDFTNYLYLEVKQCDNRTAYNLTCKSQETIIGSFKSKYAANYYFSYLYMEVTPTLDDFDDPIKSTLINRYELLDTKLTKKYTHIFKETTINDDKGWIFSDIGFKSIFSSDNIQNDFKIKDETNESILFTYSMYFGKRYEIYNRSYMKVQEVIASIGGFSKIFYLLVSIVFSYISEIIKNYDLMEVNNFEGFISYPNQTEKLHMKDCKLEIINRNIKDFRFIKYNNINKCPKKKELDLIYIIKQKLIKKIFPLSNKNKLSIIEYESLSKYNNHVFDVITYLKLFKDFNLVKKILLDDIQLKTLDIIKNKYIIDEPVNIDIFLPQLEEYKSNLNNTNEINKRLFSFIE